MNTPIETISVPLNGISDDPSPTRTGPMPRFAATTLLLLSALLAAGCGTIKGRTATEQLLVSDAVDQSVDQIDFASLSGEDVYLESKYLKAVRGVGFVNSEYIISSIRQRMIVANCRLRDNRNDAKYIVEVRVGALGSDCHEVNYGVPGSQAINQTAALVASSPLPAVPEISLARTDSCRAAAKISLFAFERETLKPVWESGTAQGISLAKSTWILGAGPFQKGHIYEGSDALQTSPIDLPEVQDARFVQPMVAFLKRPFPRIRKLDLNELESTITRPSMLAEAKSVPILNPVPEAVTEPNQADAPEATTVAATDSAPTEAVSPQTPQLDGKASKVVQATATEPVEDSPAATSQTPKPAPDTSPSETVKPSRPENAVASAT